MLSDSGAPHLREHSWTLDFHWSPERLNRDSTGLRTHDSTGLRNPSSTYPEFHRTPTLRTWYSTGLRIPGRWNPEFHRIPPGILPGPGIPAEFCRNSGSIFTRVVLISQVSSRVGNRHSKIITLSTRMSINTVCVVLCLYSTCTMYLSHSWNILIIY